jgi:hypothetical protein
VHKLTDFLEKLATDPAFEAQYDADPQGTMTGFGLKPHQIDLVLNGTAKQLRKAVQDGNPGAKAVVYLVKRG